MLQKCMGEKSRDRFLIDIYQKMIYLNHSTVWIQLICVVNSIIFQDFIMLKDHKSPLQVKTTICTKIKEETLLTTVWTDQQAALGVHHSWRIHVDIHVGVPLCQGKAVHWWSNSRYNLRNYIRSSRGGPFQSEHLGKRGSDYSGS